MLLFIFFFLLLVLLLVNEWWNPALRLQVSDCRAFPVVCDVPSTALLVKKLLNSFLVFQIFFSPLVIISVAPVITGAITCFLFHTRWIYKLTFWYFILGLLLYYIRVRWYCCITNKKLLFLFLFYVFNIFIIIIISTTWDMRWRVTQQFKYLDESLWYNRYYIWCSYSFPNLRPHLPLHNVADRKVINEDKLFTLKGY